MKILVSVEVLNCTKFYFDFALKINLDFFQRTWVMCPMSCKSPGGGNLCAHLSLLRSRVACNLIACIVPSV